MLHGIVIAGITFSDLGSGGAAPGLDVIIVSDEVPATARNDSADYLAQRSQLGGGSTLRKVAPRSQSSPATLPRHAGAADGNSLSDRADSATPSDARMLSTHSPQPTVRWLGETGAGSTSGPLPLLLDGPQNPASAGHTDDGLAQLTGPKRDELWITPNTQESRLAPWLDAWRRKVERLGTLNYPAAARRGGDHANPVLEVTITSDGKLVEARLRRSSGSAEVDQAALDILKLASPFDAFPRDVSGEYRVLRFAYEWEFDSGVAAPGTLSVPATP
jgi:protein TonB